MKPADQGSPSGFKRHNPYEHHNSSLSKSKRLKHSNDQTDSSIKCIDYADPFAISDTLEGISYKKYGSVTKDIEALVARMMQLMNSFHILHPKLTCPETITSLGVEESDLLNRNAIDLEGVTILKAASSVAPVVIIDSDEEDAGERRPPYPFQGISLQRQAEELLMKKPVVNNSMRRTSKREATTFENKLMDKGVYLGVDDELVDDGDHGTNIEDDSLADIWKEMTVALECSKDATGDQSSNEHAREDDEDCDHSFVLKDDLGYVCRVCGVIQKGIESIIEFQYIKSARTRNLQV
ncbi:hypothetical protein Ancab_018072 [Ancistrocladus abbreviatus]